MNKQQPDYPYSVILWEKIGEKEFTATYYMHISSKRSIKIEQLTFKNLESPIARRCNPYNWKDDELTHYVPEDMGGNMIVEGYENGYRTYVSYDGYYEHLPYLKDFEYPLNPD
jgi:hypothetical protein